MKKFKDYINESPSDLKKPTQKSKKLTTGKKGKNTKVKKGKNSQKKVAKKFKTSTYPQLNMN